MKKSKKAQGISFNVIIIAAVALIVLIVLIVIFTGRTSKVTSEIDKASAQIKCPDNNCKVFCSDDETEILAKTECMDNPVKIHCCVPK
ncbi:hypothetical protein ACFLYT_00575 [Nanoarchaeota archaeon]